MNIRKTTFLIFIAFGFLLKIEGATNGFEWLKHSTTCTWKSVSQTRPEKKKKKKNWRNLKVRRNKKRKRSPTRPNNVLRWRAARRWRESHLKWRRSLHNGWHELVAAGGARAGHIANVPSKSHKRWNGTFTRPGTPARTSGGDAPGRASCGPKAAEHRQLDSEGLWLRWAVMAYGALHR